MADDKLKIFLYEIGFSEQDKLNDPTWYASWRGVSGSVTFIILSEYFNENWLHRVLFFLLIVVMTFARENQ